MSGIPTIPQYYHQLMARGTEVMVSELWQTGSTVTLTLAPSAGKATFIREICWVANDAFALGGGDTIKVSPWGNSSPPEYEISSFEELISLSEYTPPSSGAATKIHKGILKFQPFILVRSSTVPAGSFEVEYVGASGLGAGDTLQLNIRGHVVDDAFVGID